MRTTPPARFWIESVLAAMSASVLVVTLYWKDWIEAIFGVDPDRQSGALEWAITLALAAMAVAFTVLAASRITVSAPEEARNE